MLHFAGICIDPQTNMIVSKEYFVWRIVIC